MATFRKSGAAVYTPVWFAEENGKLYVMTSPSTGKYKRIRNNPQIKIAPCTMRGTVTGPEFSASARILPGADGEHVRDLVRAKYWLARIPYIWRNSSVFLEITV